MLLAAYRHIVGRGDRLFLGIYHLQLADSALFQLVSHYAGKRADRGAVDICDFKAGRVDLVSSAHGAYYRSAALLRVHYKLYFSGYGVDGVNNVVILREIELVCGFGSVEGLPAVDRHVGVYIKQALFGCFYLISADGFPGGEYLAVYVGEADLVVVDDVESAYAASCEGFSGESAYAAYSEYCHSGTGKLFHGFLAENEFGS